MEVPDIMTTKITVTRALAEIKLLQKRIENGTQSLAVVGYQQNKKMKSPYNHIEIEAFEEKAKASLASVEDLIKRITAVKTAINQSNTITKVTIGGKEMTIQEALVEKSHIELKKSLLAKLKSQMNDVNRRIESAAEDVEKEISELKKSEKFDADTIEKMCESTRNSKYPVIVDPCDLSEKIENLQKEIEDFENNVDYALSESNSVTYIEV